MKEIGEVLRKRREEAHLSLKDIETATSIRTVFIKAIEEGNIHSVISSVYAQGFLKQYIHYLGLDLDKIMRQYPGAFKISGQNYEFSNGIGTLEMRGSHGGGIKWLPTFLWGFAIVLGIILSYCLIKAIGAL